MSLIIDVHCHLDHPLYGPNLDKVIERAGGMHAIISSGIEPNTNRLNLELARKYPVIKPALGLYPKDALQKEIQPEWPLQLDYDVDKELEFIRSNKNRIIAIGEVGLDYKNGSDKELQQSVFMKVIRLQKELDKPMVIHSRKAEKDILSILDEHSCNDVLLHCFSGKKSLVKEAADKGYYFSVPTNVVRSAQFQDMVKLVPLSQLFCETDSPYLSPFKDRMNEPSFVIESYKKIAELKKMELKEVVNNIYMNWQKLFLR